MSSEPTETVPDTPKDALVLFMPSGKRGRFPIGTHGARGRARPRRLCRKRMRRARHLRALPDRGAGRSVRQAQDRLRATITFRRAGPKELRYAEKRDLLPGRRLSCSATIQGDLVVDVPQDAVINAQVVRKAADDRVIERNPGRPDVLCRGRRARHAQAAGRSRPADGGAGKGLGLQGHRGRLPHPVAGAGDPAQGQLGRHRRHSRRSGNRSPDA